VGAFFSREELLNDLDRPDYAVYGTKAFKLYRFLIKLCESWPWIPRVLGRAQHIISHPSPIKVKCSALAFVARALELDATWEWFAEMFPSFLMRVLFPLFSLTSEDLRNSVDDPVTFVCENQKIADDDMSDLKAGAAKILRDAAKRRAGVVQSLLDFSIQMLPAATPSVLFSIVSCAASVVPDCSVDFDPLFRVVLPFVDHPDHLCRAAAFTLAASAARGMLALDFGNACIRHLQDQSLLVRHSAAVAFGHFLNLFAEEDESKTFIFASLQADLTSLFQILIDLSATFGDWTLGESLFHLTSFFGDHLIPIATPLIERFLDLIVTSVADSHIQFAIMCSQSLQECFHALSKFTEQAGPLYDATFEKFLEAIPALPLQFLGDSFLPAVHSMIAAAPFRPLFWSVLAHAAKELADEFARFANLLCFKDVRLFEGETDVLTNLVQLLRAALEASEFDAVFRIMTGLCLRAPPGEARVAALFPEVLQALMAEIEEGTGTAAVQVKVADAMAIFAPELVAQVLGEVFCQFVAFVVDGPSYELSPIAVIRLFDGCSGSIRGKMVLHVVDFLRAIIGGEEEDDDLDMEDEEKVAWFSREEMRRQATEFLQKIIEKESSFEGVLFSEEFAVMAQSGAVSL
jgi:hypothetical protein